LWIVRRAAAVGAIKAPQVPAMSGKSGVTPERLRKAVPADGRGVHRHPGQ